MPKQFTDSAARAIVDTVGRIRAQTNNQPAPFPGAQGEQPFRWFKLTADLAANGSADAHPMNWSAADGGYTADTSTTRTVTDTLGLFSGSTDDLVLCRPIGSSDGTVWEVVAAKGNGAGKYYLFTLSENLSGASALASATYLDGSELDANDPYDGYVWNPGEMFWGCTDDGAKGWAFYDPKSEKTWIGNITCPSSNCSP
jgi:hypothetical protein